MVLDIAVELQGVVRCQLAVDLLDIGEVFGMRHARLAPDGGNDLEHPTLP
jgi:hypothetical protein